MYAKTVSLNVQRETKYSVLYGIKNRGELKMKKGSKKWSKKNAPSRHHLWTRKMRNGREDRQQIKVLPRHLHQKWHNLVQDASPSEALFSIAEFLPEPARTKVRSLARELRVVETNPP